MAAPFNSYAACVVDYSLANNQIAKALMRNDLVSINHRLAAFLASYFDILFAINEIPHPGEKKLIDIVENQCNIKPENFKENLDKVRNICVEKNIELILFTIPNVPDRNHKLKNAYIKSLGLRFVDISLAVGAEESNNWYDGLLSSDKVHPDTKGQYVIASKVISEVPEIVDEFIRY